LRPSESLDCLQIQHWSSLGSSCLLLSPFLLPLLLQVLYQFSLSLSLFLSFSLSVSWDPATITTWKNHKNSEIKFGDSETLPRSKFDPATSVDMVFKVRAWVQFGNGLLEIVSSVQFNLIYFQVWWGPVPLSCPSLTRLPMWPVKAIPGPLLTTTPTCSAVGAQITSLNSDDLVVPKLPTCGCEWCRRLVSPSTGGDWWATCHNESCARYSRLQCCIRVSFLLPPPFYQGTETEVSVTRDWTGKKEKEKWR